MRTLIMMLPLLVLAACGGRAAHPVETVQPIDSQLSCAHITAERENNRKRVVELVGEQGETVRDNIGMLVMMPVFLALDGAEQREIEAIGARDKRLDELAQTAGCNATSAAQP